MGTLRKANMTAQGRPHKSNTEILHIYDCIVQG